MIRVLVFICFLTLSDCFLRNFVNHHCSLMVLHDIEIRLQGTANAYTSLRNYDAVLYTLDAPINNKSVSLGIYRSDIDDGVIIPLKGLCDDDEIFYYDEDRGYLRAEDLHENDKILRIVSSSRKGEKAVVVDEYLDTSLVFYHMT